MIEAICERAKTQTLHSAHRVYLYVTYSFAQQAVSIFVNNIQRLVLSRGIFFSLRYKLHFRILLWRIAGCKGVIMLRITFPNRSTAISLTAFTGGMTSCLPPPHPTPHPRPPVLSASVPFRPGLKPAGRNKTALIVRYCLVHSDGRVSGICAEKSAIYFIVPWFSKSRGNWRCIMW